ncbi:MAG: LapA family protein [Nostochopsis sp.]
MALLRLTLLVAIMGGLALLLAQNWSPILPLVFLGVQTKSLPLAMWILFSTAAGAATSVVISGLFQLSGYLAVPQRSTSAAPKSRKTTARSDRSTQEKSADSHSSYTSPPPSATKTSSQSNADDDWDTNNNEDWDFEEDPTSSQNTEVRDSKSYERRQEPTDSFRAGSSYSYSYREPKNSGVGKTESIYDADYRVIIPPYQPSSNDFTDKDNPTDKNNQVDEEDWGFLDDIDNNQRER